MKKVILFMLLLALGFEACKDEKCYPESDEINPETDMIGYLQPTNSSQPVGILYYMPGYLEVIISELGAQSVDTNLYELKAPAIIGGDTILSIFTTAEVPIPYYFSHEEPQGDEMVAKHKVYKNAECKEHIPALEDDDCMWIEEWSQGIKVEITGWNKCRKGNSYCIEIEQVIGERKHYDDKECSVLVKTEDYIEFSCKK